MHSIRYLPKNHEMTPYLMQTQNRLKLLIVLINLLVSHLSRLDHKLTYDFVEVLSPMVNNALTSEDMVKAYK